MPVTCIADLLTMLRQENDESIAGTEESSWCDFKGQPYQLDDTRSQWELGKDVSALANAAGGGAIVIAVRTEKPDNRDEEVATGVVPVPRVMIDRKRYQDVIKERTYPPLGDRVKFHLFDRDGDKALLVIEVSEIESDQWPVLITESLKDGKRKFKTFSIARRVGAHTEWVPIGQIHRDISDGRISRRRLENNE
jgi:hypothetical protein